MKFIEEDKERLLELIRHERSCQVIHEVLDYEEIEGYSFIKVKVDMPTQFFDTTIQHSAHWIPFPMKEYEKLSEEEEREVYHKYFSAF